MAMDISVARRPWEDSRASPQTPQAQSNQTLPSISTLTANMSIGTVPPPEKSPAQNTVERDSGNWSMSQSARTSLDFTFIFILSITPVLWFQLYLFILGFNSLVS
jgi:hypothetical protein